MAERSARQVQRGEDSAPRRRGAAFKKLKGRLDPVEIAMLRRANTNVEDRTPALLVYSQEHPLQDVKDLLIRQGLDTVRVHNCGQAVRLLCSNTPPVLVFTAVDLPDGSWEDILESATAARCPVPVIVVANQDDVRFSLRVWENGAAGWVAPPFSEHELARVVRQAMLSGFLASSTAGISTEGFYLNAENHMGARGLPTQA
jgi:DNA-binding response OmpR family regulator